jgi:CHASE3 domain sensor protein
VAGGAIGKALAPCIRVKRLTSPRKIQTAAILLLIAAVGMLALVIHEYLRDRDACQLLYTRSVKKRDIVDAARNAISALNDAELREQNYVLTGETLYSEAYADDIRTWQDELASLQLVARNDPATPLVEDFSQAGTRTVSELTLVVSLYEKSGRDAALERIRKSSGIVYLDQARSNVAKIQEIDGGANDLTRQMVTRTLSYFRRLAAGAAALFFLTVTGTLFLMLKMIPNR